MIDATQSQMFQKGKHVTIYTYTCIHIHTESKHRQNIKQLVICIKDTWEVFHHSYNFSVSLNLFPKKKLQKGQMKDITFKDKNE